MNIIFTGYRCTGKTSAGRRLAALLGRDFYDADELIIRRAGRSIEQIVAEGGWPAFRELERAVIAELSGKDHCVIAPGGGAILDERNVEHLKIKGFFVWLVADSATIAQRLNKDQTGGAPRPSLTGKPVATEIQEILAQREPIYRRIADLVVDTSHRTVEEVADTALQRLKRAERRIPLTRLSSVGREVPVPIHWARPFRGIADLIIDDAAQTAKGIATLIVERLGRDQAEEVAAAIRAGLVKQPELVCRKEI
jgi:shikimate kinase